MNGGRWAFLAGALALATTAAAQTDTQREQPNKQDTMRARCADPCQACMRAIQNGNSAEGEACPNACSRCDDERRAQAGRSAGQPTTGGDVRTSLDQAGKNISQSVSSAANDVKQGLGQMEQSQNRGLEGRGPMMNTLITDVVGSFTGQGLNAEYQRPIADRISGVVGANYSRTTSTTGSLTAFGGEVGADYFPFTMAGQGLRLGPRVALSFGQESVDHSRFFTDFGLGGELGYNWVGSSGLSLQAAVGLGGKVGGALTSGLDTRLGGDFGPYGKINVGWSW